MTSKAGTHIPPYPPIAPYPFIQPSLPVPPFIMRNTLETGSYAAFRLLVDNIRAVKTNGGVIA